MPPSPEFARRAAEYATACDALDATEIGAPGNDVLAAAVLEARRRLFAAMGDEVEWETVLPDGRRVKAVVRPYRDHRLFAAEVEPLTPTPEGA